MERTTALRIVALLRKIMNHAVEDRLIPFTSGHGGPLRPSGSGRNRSAVDRLAAATNCNLYATDEEAREERREVSSDEDWSRRRDLNPRPADYESAALPLSYTGFSRTYERCSRDFTSMC